MMNKAAFDRAYKAIRGHMLQPVVIVTPTGEALNIKRVIFDEVSQELKIIAEEK